MQANERLTLVKALETHDNQSHLKERFNLQKNQFPFQADRFAKYACILDVIINRGGTEWIPNLEALGKELAEDLKEYRAHFQ